MMEDDSLNSFFIGTLLILTVLIVVVGFIMFLIYAIKGDVFQCVCSTGSTGTIFNQIENPYMKSIQKNSGLSEHDSAMVKILFVNGKPVVQHIEKLEEEEEEDAEEEKESNDREQETKANKTKIKEETGSEDEPKVFYKIHKVEKEMLDDHQTILKIQFSMNDCGYKAKKYAIVIKDPENKNELTRTKEFDLQNSTYEQEWIQIKISNSGKFTDEFNVIIIDTLSDTILDQFIC